MKWDKTKTIAQLAKLNGVSLNRMKYLVRKYDMGYKGKVLPPEWVADRGIEPCESSQIGRPWDEVSVCL